MQNISHCDRNNRINILQLEMRLNGEGGIRTPVEFPQNAFRVRHHQPLGHLSRYELTGLSVLKVQPL